MEYWSDVNTEDNVTFVVLRACATCPRVARAAFRSDEQAQSRIPDYGRVDGGYFLAPSRVEAFSQSVVRCCIVRGVISFMPLSVRLDQKTESLVGRLARKRRQTKSEVMRDAIGRRSVLQVKVVNPVEFIRNEGSRYGEG